MICSQPVRDNLARFPAKSPVRDLRPLHFFEKVSVNFGSPNLGARTSNPSMVVVMVGNFVSSMAPRTEDGSG
jgi:hypothetical protein